MIHPYSETYLDLVQRNVGVVFDLLLRQERMDESEFSRLFSGSEVAQGIESSHPDFLAGRSGQELASIIIDRPIRYPDGYVMIAGPEYWTGFVVAYLQWKFFRPFSIILERYPVSMFLDNYERLHSSSLDYIADEIGTYLVEDNIIKTRRKALGYTQSELAGFANMNIRTLRGYEQGTLDIGKAAGDTLYNLSRSLGCSIEDLLKR
ncbi:MAG: helix-turn-helix transcriptional regulator [Candidatus Methanomethylophilaceae archaeon]|nr:helix-turn-helix transcriptional regulator [Candidatus Methanomethylophilaceae archaeon]